MHSMLYNMCRLTHPSFQMVLNLLSCRTWTMFRWINARPARIQQDRGR
jgi:hypothetical protein